MYVTKIFSWRVRRQINRRTNKQTDGYYTKNTWPYFKGLISVPICNKSLSTLYMHSWNINIYFHWNLFSRLYYRHGHIWRDWCLIYAHLSKPRYVKLWLSGLNYDFNSINFFSFVLKMCVCVRARVCRCAYVRLLSSWLQCFQG